MMRIIDNKRVEMTNDEFALYKSIARSYDRQNFKGEDLFKDHFETNGEGIIIFVKPPASKYTSMEVFCFLTSLMVNQHLRISHAQVTSLVKEAEEKITTLVKEIDDLKSSVEKTKTIESRPEKRSKSKGKK